MSSLTEHQERAITRSHGLVCVEAGAGAGKTLVIAERFLYLVREEGLRPNEILTITYTRKAAQEMKQRILAGLDKAGMHAARREVENGYIQTIHGFCERLLRENPFDAGVDPAFPVMKEGDSARLRERSFELATGEALRSSGPLPQLVSSASTLHGWGAQGEMLGVLRKQVEDLLEQVRSFGLSQRDLQEWAEREEAAVDATGAEALRQSLEEVTSQIESLIVPTKDPALADIWKRLRALPADDSRKPLLDEFYRIPKAKLTAPAQATLTELKKLSKAAISTIDTVQLEDEKRAAIRSAGLLRLALLMWRHYEHLKSLEGQLDFSDLEHCAVRLLEGCEPIKNRYRLRFKQLLVDEFQDVNPIQARLVQALSSGDNVCFVGDPRQSIYRFRHADVTQFMDWSKDAKRREEAEPESACHVPLDLNFRSRPGILQFVSAIMERLKRPEFGTLVAHRGFLDDGTPPVEVWYGAMDRPSEDARMVAMGIRGMMSDSHIRIETPEGLRPPRWSDFALLFRFTPRIDEYQRALFAAGIPNQIVMAGRNYYARYEVRDVRNALQAIAHPQDDLALACLLRSPMVGLSMDALTLLCSRSSENGEPRPQLIQILSEPPARLPDSDCEKIARFLEWFPDLSVYADRREVGEVMERVLTETRYAAKLLCREDGARQLANVRKLLQMAVDAREMTLTEFVRRLDRLVKIYQREGDAPTHEDDADVVRLMTVHAAKGLEFPIVVLPQMFGSPPPFNDLVMADPKTRRIGSKVGDYKSVMFNQVMNQKKDEQTDEAMRLLYVAMTRARDYLALCLPSQTKGRSGDSWAAWCRSALAFNSPTIPAGIREVREGVPYRVRDISDPENLAQ